MHQACSAPIPPALSSGHHSDGLADFRTDRRVLLLCLLALPIGAIGAVVAKALLWLIAVITNLAFFLRWSSAPVTPETNHLGAWVILVPVVGSLLIVVLVCAVLWWFWPFRDRTGRDRRG